MHCMGPKEATVRECYRVSEWLVLSPPPTLPNPNANISINDNDDDNYRYRSETRNISINDNDNGGENRRTQPHNPPAILAMCRFSVILNHTR